MIATKLRKYFEKTKDKVLTIRNIRRHFGCYGFSDNLPILGKLALVAAFFTLALASCSKDDISSDTDLVVSPPADSEAPSYYAITDAEGIGFTKDGIAYEYISNGKTRWVLSYQEIAKRLDIDISKISTIKITRDQILKNGLWRFDVRFDGQQEGTAYAIDVDPENGKIEWVITLEDMPGGNVFTLTLNS